MMLLTKALFQFDFNDNQLRGSYIGHISFFMKGIYGLGA